MATLAGYLGQSLAGELAPANAGDVDIARPTTLNALRVRPRFVVDATNVLGTYGGAPYTAAVATIKDQSGAARDIAKVGTAATIGTDAAGKAAFVMAATPTSYSRADALGLAPDPALTIAWRCSVTDASPFPTLLSLGTDGAEEFVLGFGADGSFDYVLASNSTLTAYVFFPLPLGSLASEHSFILTKPAGVGYSSDWRLDVDGLAAEAPSNGATVPGALAIGATSCILGDAGYSSLPFVGTLTGLALWDSVLFGNDLDAVREFLSYR